MRVSAIGLVLLVVSCVATGSTKGCSIRFGSAPASSDALVFRNFTLIDGGDREPIQQAAMVVEQGRVSWVGPASELKAPDGAMTTDLNGTFVTPGRVPSLTARGTTHYFCSEQCRTEFQHKERR